ncbi:MAG TPA: HAD family hydrolase [Steroidobacteraceae bacterium]|jgi:Cof subfamily protein (haloacid dehalogenase superfamily)|nr:HAD family hydrolase [Steroidobacteraceae bacterium]
MTPAIRLVGIDVDGTLVGATGTVNARVWPAAERAREAGIRLALCSGRPAFGTAVEYARCLDAHGWHVFQNGASVVNLGSGESRSAPLPRECVDTLIAQARATRRVLELYSDRDYVVESNGDWAHAHADLLGVPFEPRRFDTLRGVCVRAQWLVTAADANLVRAALPSGVEIAQSTSPLMPETQFVGITRSGVSKGSAIESVAGEYRVALRQVMYIGDAGNDLPALQRVGHPVAMGDAAPAVRASAKYTVGGPEEGGVADALDIALATY